MRSTDASPLRGESGAVPPRIAEPEQHSLPRDGFTMPKGAELRGALQEAMAGRVVPLIGPPASGKGTNGKLLSKASGAVHIGVGDLVRDEIKRQTELGGELQAYASRGDIAPDELILPMVERRLSMPDVHRGVVLDGFPRSPGQARALSYVLENAGLSLLAAVYLNVPDRICVGRMQKRMAERSENRSDDNLEVFKHRLNEFHLETKPLLPFFDQSGKLLRIDGSGGLRGTQRGVRRGILETAAARDLLE